MIEIRGPRVKFRGPKSEFHGSPSSSPGSNAGGTGALSYFRITPATGVGSKLGRALRLEPWGFDGLGYLREVKSIVSFVKIYRQPYPHHRTTNSCSRTLYV